MEPDPADRSVSHETSSAVWDVPSPVAVNGQFKIKVGVVCSLRCRLAGRFVSVLDEAGNTIDTGILGPDPWAGTSALYWKEVALTAPATQGLTCRSLTLTVARGDVRSFDDSSSESATSQQPLHEAVVTFTFRTDRSPQHRIAVTVTRQDTGEPLEGVEVRLGLYSGSTRSSGRVELDLPAGKFELTIRKNGFAAAPVALEVTTSVSIDVRATRVPTRAEMDERLFADYPWG